MGSEDVGTVRGVLRFLRGVLVAVMVCLFVMWAAAKQRAVRHPRELLENAKDKRV